MKRKASLVALKDLMEGVIKPSLLSSFKLPSKEGKEDKSLEMPKMKEACDMEGECEDDSMEMPEIKEVAKPKALSITRVSVLEKQKEPKKFPKSKKK